jgi:hypothetical protein
MLTEKQGKYSSLVADVYNNDLIVAGGAFAVLETHSREIER